MKQIILLITFSLTILNAKDYAVKLFDTNTSNGIWQMVGTLGLKDVSVEGVTYSSGSEPTTEDPTIPDEDTGGTIVITPISDSEDVYAESGLSEDDIEIANIFDINLTDTNFNKLNSTDGELSVYRYNGVYFDDTWSYYNSKNSAEGNDFFKFEKGRGYWAKYQDENLNFETNSSYMSNSGFIFSDDFKIGLATYEGKVFEGWNLLSLPEKRTVEIVYIAILDYNISRDYNLTIGKKDNLNKVKINFSNTADKTTPVSISNATKNLNSVLNELEIFAIESNISSTNSQITFLSRKEFVISDDTNMTIIPVTNITDRIFYDGNVTTSSKYVYGLVVEINSKFISNFSSLKINLNGEDIDIITEDLRSEDISSFELIGSDKNLTFIFSDNNFYLKHNNYIKSYEYNGSKRPDNFFSIDENTTIFQIAKDRKDINNSLTIIQNSINHEIIRGYGNIADLISDLSFEDNIVKFPQLTQAFNYMKTYSFPKTDNLKYFLEQILKGYSATQILSLKTESTNSGDWDSVPINSDLTDWTSFKSKYDPAFFIDKRRSYWVKFSPKSTTTSDFLIDTEQTSISRYVTHQLSEDNKTITNIIHYNIQIFLKNVSKAIRGYIKIDNLEIELKPELDGTLLTAEIDYESLYNISNLDLVSEVIAVIIDENGIEKTTKLDINFTKPEKPSALIKLSDIVKDTHYRTYQDDLGSFKTTTNIYPDFCYDLGVSKIYVIKTDSNDTTLDRNRLILSNPVQITYTSLYKSTSKLSSNISSEVEQPIKYNESCEKISENSVKTEGIVLGNSENQLHLFYKKSSEYVTGTLSPPKVMYISINSQIIRIGFDTSYDGNDFYILDSDENIFKGKFISVLHNDNQSPLILKKIE